ncbi:hypothetical protein CCMA1212_008065 [Trichoderma ghanense]|uniref:Uncharacterized protein n=1 Tax=Trichoderma ghanense TaxID=65468 RepID=A0ABY2GVP7_9HYPO
MHCIDLLLQPCRAGQANQRRQQEYMASQGTKLSKGCVRGRSNSNGDGFVLLCGVREPPILTAPCRGPLPSELKQLLIGFSKCAQQRTLPPVVLEGDNTISNLSVHDGMLKSELSAVGETVERRKHCTCPGRVNHNRVSCSDTPVILSEDREQSAMPHGLDPGLVGR